MNTPIPVAPSSRQLAKYLAQLAPQGLYVVAGVARGWRLGTRSSVRQWRVALILQSPGWRGRGLDAITRVGLLTPLGAQDLDEGDRRAWPYCRALVAIAPLTVARVARCRPTAK